MRLFLLLIVLLAASACSRPLNDAGAAPAAPAPAPAAADDAGRMLGGIGKTAAPGEVDRRCETDADCAVKNVGNCCGEFPACVNADSPTFPEQVQAACAESGMMSVCGFRDVAGCTCVDNTCTDVYADGGDTPVVR